MFPGGLDDRGGRSYATVVLHYPELGSDRVLVGRPRTAPIPCDACGELIDPLRSRVLASTRGLHVLCGDACVEQLIRAEQSRPAAPPEVVSVPDRVREATRPTATHVREDLGAQSDLSDEPVNVPWIGIALATTATVFGAVPGPLWLHTVSALLGVAAACYAMHASWRMTRAGVIAWALGPLGLMFATGAALGIRSSDPERWMVLAGTGIAALAVVLRAWLDARGRLPVAEQLVKLIRSIPSSVRVPVRQPDTEAHGERYEEVPAHRVRVGEEVIVLEGERVAVDGVVKKGSSQILPLPGSRAPVRREPGDSVIAGAEVRSGALRLLTNRVGNDRALVRAVRFGSGAEVSSAKIAWLAMQLTRWGLVGVGVVCAFALARGEGVLSALLVAATVLLAAPVLSVRRAAEGPLLAAGGAAAERGIVFRDAGVLEEAGKARAAAVCTRGTITEGALDVVDVKPVGDSDVHTILALAAAAEVAAESHPIGLAIRRYAESRGIQPESVRRATFVPGRGITALAPSGASLVIGNRQLLLEEGVSVAVADSIAANAEQRGHTVLFVGVGGRVRAIIALQDNVRLGARAALQRLFDLGVEAVLISGDHRGAVEALARNLDVDNIRAELRPEERGPEIRRMRDSGSSVAAIGHPLVDDAALSAADIPICLGAAGSQTGERAIALVNHDVRDAAAALWIAHAARAEAYRSVLVSAGAGGLLVGVAAFGWIGPGVAALCALGIDSLATHAGARLLRRIELRIPARA